MNYSELQVTSNFSFLEGASHPGELVEQAALYGYKEIAITDRNSFAGIVRAHAAAKTKNIRLIPACYIHLLDGSSSLAYPTNKFAYSQLSSLLTIGNRRAEKGECHLYKEDVYAYRQGIKFIVVPPSGLNNTFEFDVPFEKILQEYKSVFGNDIYVAASRRYSGDDNKYLYQLAQLSKRLEMKMVATNEVHYHNLQRRQLQDVLTCIREKCTIQNAGFHLHPNAERHLKPIDEMLRLFRHYPEAIHHTQEIAEACQFSLSELKYEYPEELTTEGRTPLQEITYLAWQGAKERFPDNIPQKIIDSIHHELAFIEEMNFANYFLTVYDIVRFARSKNILCQGRGSAANSTVCYCLGITSVDPTKFDLLFERFISSARNEPPDIDVDFEHERREEVIQYIYEKYGRDRAGLTATVVHYRHKRARREVSKVLELSDDTFPDPKSLAGKLIEGLVGFPRHLSQHVGGFVIAR